MRRLLPLLLLVPAAALALWMLAEDEDGAPGALDRPSARAADASADEDAFGPGSLVQDGAAEPGATAREPVAEDEPAARSKNTRALTLVVRARTSWRDDGVPVPDLGVVVGVARDAAHAEGPVGEHKRLLARGTTDAEGDAELVLALPLDALAAWGEDARLWGAVDEPGKRANVLVDPVPDGARGELELYPRGGWSLHGRVVRADGTPAHPAEVRLFAQPDGDADHDLPEDAARVDAHGGFRLDADEPGVFDVQASALGQGSAGAFGVRVGPGGAEELVLELSGDGVVAGVLLDPAGAPVPRYRLWCLPAEHRDRHVGYLHDPEVFPHEWGGGLYGDHGETDEQGRFRFEGLRAGEYHLRGHTATSGYYEELLTDAPVASGTEDLTLVLARHRLLVRVFDHEGARIAVDPEHRPGRDEPAEHALYLEPCDAQGRVLAAERYTHDTREALANGDLVLDVEPGRRYMLGVFSKECSLVERRIDVTPGAFESVVEIALPPPVPGTVLEVELQDPGGAPYEQSNSQRVYAPRSGRLLWETDRWHDDALVRIPIGPGRYRWEADARPPRGHHGERWKPTPHAPVAETLTVLGGRVNRFERRLADAGSLALLVTTDRVPAAPAELTPREQEALSWSERVRRRHGGAAVRLVGPDGPVPAVFSHGPASELFGERVTLGAIEGEWVVPGERATTVEPIPPGRYRLEVELEGVGRRAVDVDVRADATAEVTVDLDA